jgi:hypothetical protein
MRCPADPIARREGPLGSQRRKLANSTEVPFRPECGCWPTLRCVRVCQFRRGFRSSQVWMTKVASVWELFTASNACRGVIRSSVDVRPCAVLQACEVNCRVGTSKVANLAVAVLPRGHEWGIQAARPLACHSPERHSRRRPGALGRSARDTGAGHKLATRNCKHSTGVGFIRVRLATFGELGAIGGRDELSPRRGAASLQAASEDFHRA